MIERYSRPEMASIWTNSARYDLWLAIELAVCEAWGRRGRIPKDALSTIERRAGYDEERIGEIEAEVGHDVIAFLTAVAERVGPDSRYVHIGLTSSDILDTAFAVQLVRAGRIIRADLDALIGTIRGLAFKYKDTPMIGRSHGMHAEPITFGLKLAVWYAEFSRHVRRLDEAIGGVAVGKISGAVGVYAHGDPGIEGEVCERLGLSPAPISTQIVQRDRHAHYFSVLAGIAASVEKAAVEIRNLQRTEVGEVAEPFGQRQKGSSAMPQKRNPVMCENLTGLSRIVRANSMAAFENVALWHERDITHSSVERVIAPDSTILVDFMLSRLADILERLDVYPERMRANIESRKGAYAAQGVMLELARAGMAREEAYEIVQDISRRAAEEGRPLYDLLMENREVTSRIDKTELKDLFDIGIHLKHVDRIFERVFEE